MKTKEELNALKAEVKALNNKLHELTEEELKQVVGGFFKEDDIDRINILHNSFLKKYPDKSATIDFLYSLFENSCQEFSYSDVLNMVSSLL